MRVIIFWVLAQCVCLSYGFYVPGVAPTDFRKGDKITVKAIKMTSSHTQLPFEYYSLPFCQPKEGIQYKTENLGEILRGDRISSTAYDVEMNVQYDCRVLCGSSDSPTKFDTAASAAAHYRIEQEYFIHLIVDNLPCATVFQLPEMPEPQYEPGFRLGFVRDGKMYINNHLTLLLKYHYSEADQIYRVVGFQVETKSLSKDRISIGKDGTSCTIKDSGSFQEIKKDGQNELFFTYSVKWEESPIRWASRWDMYLSMADVQIHWFSIVNSVVVVFFLSGIITMIIIRTLRRYGTNMNVMLLSYLLLFSEILPNTIQMMIWKKVWKKLDGSLFTETFSDLRMPIDYSSRLLAQAFKFSA